MQIRTGRRAAVLTTGALLALTTACIGKAPPPGGPESERVHVGYGTQDPRDVTGSVSSLTEADIDEYGYSRLEEVLRYQVPGLDVSRNRNGDYTLRIRGTRSLIAGSEPLVVIDGIAASGRSAMDALSLVNPGSIARVDVLKDAGSLAAFGSRGVNGVILITTKRGS